MRSCEGDERAGVRAAALVALAAAVARAAYVAFACPYSLVEDETHYLQWALALDWAYYSKGPGVALLIRAGVEVFGDSEAGVRAGSIAASLAATIGVGALASSLAPERARARAGAIAALLFSLVPHFFVPALVATTDMANLACWSVALLALWKSLESGAARWWTAFAIALACGLLVRPTIVFLVPAALGLGFARGRGLGATAAAAAGLVGLAPSVAWNASHAWGTWRHLLGHLGASGGDMPARDWAYDPSWTLELLGSQAGLVGPSIVLMGAGVWAMLRAARGEGEPRARRAGWFLVATSGPIAAFYVLVSLRADAEGTWLSPAFVGPTAAAACASMRGRGARRLLVASLAYGAAVGAVLLRLDLVDRALPGVVSVRRFLGAREAGVFLRDVALRAGPPDARHGTAEDAGEIFFIAKHYGRASLAWYVIPGRPRVRCASSRLGGRACQQDYWPDHDLDATDLLGRDAVLIGGEADEWAPAFDLVETIEIPGDERRRHKLLERVHVGRGYRGLARPGEGRP